MSKQEKRLEEQVICQAPITVVLGGDKYDIKPLVIRDSREWKPKVVALMRELPKQLGVTSDDPDAFGSALDSILITSPNKVIDLFFEYAKDLNPEEIEGKATDDELAVAFSAIIAVAFPLAKSLPNALGTISQ